MLAILHQAMDDYVKMQHPRCRRRKYEKEAFWSARDLFWNKNHELNIISEEGTPVTLQTLALAASGRGNVNLNNLHSHLVNESIKYWKEKHVKTISIPEDVVIEGHAYMVEQADSPHIDFDAKTIQLDKKNPAAEKQFMQLVIELSCHHREIRTSAKARRELSEAVYELLRMNDCFTGD